MAGKLVCFCGIDGSGKSTHVDAAGAYARAHGVSTKTVSLISSTDHFFVELMKFRDAIHDDTYCNLVVFQRYLVACRDLPKYLDEYDLVFCDRYFFCDQAYIDAYGSRCEVLDTVRDLVPKPDATFLFDAEVDIALARIYSRGRPIPVEQENEEILTRARQAYLRHAPDWNAVCIDTSDASPEETQAVVVCELRKLLPHRFDRPLAISRLSLK